MCSMLRQLSTQTDVDSKDNFNQITVDIITNCFYVDFNPGDHASGGLSIKNFLKRTQWKAGPAFQMSPESCWPEQPTFILHLCFPPFDPHIKKGNISCFLSPVHAYSLDDLFEKYSSWFIILKVCAWILRFVSALKSRVIQTNGLTLRVTCH